MRATCDRSAHNGRVVRLGSSNETRSKGRYARLMGSYWRHRRTDSIGLAAAGLFSFVLSFCADQEVSVVPRDRMRALYRGDSNGARALKQLLAAGYVEETEAGFRVHDWKQHNQPTKPHLSVVGGSDAATRQRRGSDEPATSAPPETIEEVAVSRAYALTQVPEREEKEEREEPPTGVRTVPAMPPPAPPLEGRPRPRPGPRKARPPKPPDTRAETLREELKRAEREQRLVAAPLSARTLADAVKRAQALADQQGTDFAAAARQLANGACERAQKRGQAVRWALVDWQPGQTHPQPREGRQGAPGRRHGPAPCGSFEDFNGPEAEARFARQLAKLQGLA